MIAKHHLQAAHTTPVSRGDVQGDFCLEPTVERVLNDARSVAMAGLASLDPSRAAVARAYHAAREMMALPVIGCSAPPPVPDWAAVRLGLSPDWVVGGGHHVEDGLRLGATERVASGSTGVMEYLRAPGSTEPVSAKEGRIMRRRDRDVLSMLVSRRSIPARLGVKGAWYSELYERAGPHKYGSDVGIKLCRLERFAASTGGAFAQSEEARMSRVLEDVKLLTTVEDQVRASCGIAGLEALNLIVVQGATLEAAMASPALVSIVRGGRGARPRGRFMLLLRSALEALPTPGAGPSAAKTSYTGGRGAGGV